MMQVFGSQSKIRLFFLFCLVSSVIRFFASLDERIPAVPSRTQGCVSATNTTVQRMAMISTSNGSSALKLLENGDVGAHGLPRKCLVGPHASDWLALIERMHEP